MTRRRYRQDNYYRPQYSSEEEEIPEEEDQPFHVKYQDEILDMYIDVVDNYRDVAKKLMKFKASNFLNKKGQPAKGLQEDWENMLIEYNIPLFRKFPNVVDFLKYTEKYFNKRGRDIMKRIDKMRYVHGRPAKAYTFNRGTK